MQAMPKLLFYPLSINCQYARSSSNSKGFNVNYPHLLCVATKRNIGISSHGCINPNSGII